MATHIRTHFEWQVFQKAFDVAMQIFQASKAFPRAETYSLTDQIRRSSRSVCANLSEGVAEAPVSQRLRGKTFGRRK